MGEASFYNDAISRETFKIDYPYYGLFGTALITPQFSQEEVIYKCRLLNGTTLVLKKLFSSKKWVDAALDAETPLASIIGLSIDDFMSIKKGA